MIEEQYNSMAEEVEAKTRKLRKVWNKLQAAQTEIRDLTDEFQKEREDMLDTIRELNKQLKFKTLLLDAFVPITEQEKIEQRAVWDEDADEWSLRNLQLSGNRLRVRRPPATTAPAMQAMLLAMPMASAKPQSQYAALRAQQEPDNPRFKTDNLATLELEMPPRTTEDYTGPATRQKIKISAQVRSVMNAQSIN